MAYTKFSTKKADYVLQLGLHDKENKQVDIFKGIDALVIETGHCRLENLLEWGLPQFDTAIGYCEDNDILIFGTDVPSYVSNIKDALINTIPFLVYNKFQRNSSNKKLNNLFSMFYSSYFFAMQDVVVAARNAVNARKIEEFVVNRVKETTGKERPKIGLIFGEGHTGLKQDLCSKLRRNITLWNYRNLNFKKYAGLNKRELNKVYEGRFECLSWEVEEHSVDLFE